MTYQTAELIESVFLRPRMFCDAADLGELLLFIQGICTGRRPPHGSDCLPGFAEYVAARAGRAPGAPWPAVLRDEFGGLPFDEACSAVAELVRGWRRAEEAHAGPAGA
jgi:hypothetical protein